MSVNGDVGWDSPPSQSQAPTSSSVEHFSYGPEYGCCKYRIECLQETTLRQSDWRLDHLEERMSEDGRSADDFLSLVADTENRIRGGVRFWQQQCPNWRIKSVSPWLCVDCGDVQNFEDLTLHDRQHATNSFGKLRPTFSMPKERLC